MKWLAVAAIGSALLTEQVLAVPRILLYTKCTGYYHESIPTAVETITAIGNGSLSIPSADIDASISSLRWQAVTSNDESTFRNATYLSEFDAIGFIMTTDVDPPGAGTVLDNQGIRNFAAYIQDGGGFFGVHSAAATLFGAPFFGRLLGAFFDYHPSIQNVSIKPVTLDHPSTSKLPADGFEVYEEVYNFRSDPRQLPTPAQLLLTNASSYNDGGLNPQGFRNGTNGPAPHPLAWFREGGLLDTNAETDTSVSGGGGANVDPSGGPGRSWYTSLGHDVTTWRQDYFRGHIAGGIGWVLQSSTIRSNNASASVGQASATPRGGGSVTSANAGPSATNKDTSPSATGTSANAAVKATFAPASLLLPYCLTALALAAGAVMASI